MARKKEGIIEICRKRETSGRNVIHGEKKGEKGRVVDLLMFQTSFQSAAPPRLLQQYLNGKTSALR